MIELFVGITYRSILLDVCHRNECGEYKVYLLWKVNGGRYSEMQNCWTHLPPLSIMENISCNIWLSTTTSLRSSGR